VAAPLSVTPAVKGVLARLQDAGHQAYIVGGAVRDLLLDRVPKDYDIATSATPEEVRHVFGRAARLIGRRFRLAHVYCGRTCYEVSTFRREPSPEERKTRATDDGVMIWQDNQFGTLEQDARRRDFTVNAIYYNPLREPHFRDDCGGIPDLRAGLVRAIGDPGLRLAEDPVRVLRALKLVAEYGFRLDSSLATPVREQAPALSRSSPARLYEELLKIARKPYCAETFAACRQYGLLQHFLPAMDRLWDGSAGELLRRLLAERDRRLGGGEYSHSRALALATAAFAPAWLAMGAPPGGLWEHNEGIEKTLRESVRKSYSPLPVPRVLTARARDILLLLPRFRQPAAKRRLLRHPEYRYARELYSLLSAIHGWDAAALADWPPSGTGPFERHGARPRYMHRPHHKEWQAP